MVRGVGSNTSDLARISRAAVIFIIGKTINKGSLFFLNVILAQTLGVSAYGIYSYGRGIFTILLNFSDFGASNALMRFIPVYKSDDEKQNLVFGLGLVTVLAASPTLGYLIYISGPFITQKTLGDQSLTMVLQIMVFGLPFAILVKYFSTIFRSIDLPEYQVLISNVSRPISQVIIVGSAAVLVQTLQSVVVAFVGSLILTALVALMAVLKLTRLRPHFRYNIDELKNYFEFSLPVGLNQTGSVLYSSVDVLMVGLLLSSTSVGIYSVSVLLSRFITMPLTAFGQLFAPKASELYGDGNHQQLASIYSQISRWTFTVSIPLTLVCIVYAEQLLLIFGEAFAIGVPVLTLLALSQLTNASVGPGGQLLIMTDHPQITVYNQWILGILNIALNYVLILNYGVLGAAAATAFTIATINLLRVIELWYLERLIPYTKRLYKPIIAGIASASGMYLLTPFIDGIFLLTGGGIIGIVVFISVLYMFGIEEEDVIFLKSVYQNE